MSTPPMRIGAPAFSPWTSENFAVKSTERSKSLRSSPMRKMTSAEKSIPASTKRPTWMLRVLMTDRHLGAPGGRRHVLSSSCHAASRPEERFYVLVDRSGAGDEILDAGVPARLEVGRGP